MLPQGHLGTTVVPPMAVCNGTSVTIMMLTYGSIGGLREWQRLVGENAYLIGSTATSSITSSCEHHDHHSITVTQASKVRVCKTSLRIGRST